jgi:hypothetical protein
MCEPPSSCWQSGHLLSVRRPIIRALWSSTTRPYEKPVLTAGPHVAPLRVSEGIAELPISDPAQLAVVVVVDGAGIGRPGGGQCACVADRVCRVAQRLRVPPSVRWLWPQAAAGGILVGVLPCCTCCCPCCSSFCVKGQCVLSYHGTSPRQRHTCLIDVPCCLLCGQVGHPFPAQPLCAGP